MLFQVMGSKLKNPLKIDLCDIITLELYMDISCVTVARKIFSNSNKSAWFLNIT